MRRTVVTGIGIALGEARDKETFAANCFAGKLALRPCSVMDTTGLSTEQFGEAEGVTGAIDGENHRFLELVQEAGNSLLRDAKLTAEDISRLGRKCRLFFGSLIFCEAPYYHHALEKRAGRGDRDSAIARMNYFSQYARKLFGVQGSTTVISSACASGTTAVGMAMSYIRAGVLEAAVAGGADALSPLTAYGFNALKSMSAGVCNPFDESHDGINIGECGAFLLLESLEHAQARGAQILGEVVGASLGNDAYHITSPRPNGEGAYAAMAAALADARLSPKDIGYINAHGTGTVANDTMELKAIGKLFGGAGREIALSSTKALTGHCMGASGAMEIASTLMALRDQRYIPMPRLQQSLPAAENLRMSASPGSIDAEYAIKNSFAFAGNSAAVVLKRWGGSAS